MSFKKNVGSTDRIVRIVLAVVLAALALTGTVGGALAIVFYVLAAVFVATALVSFCPLYLPFKLSTRK
jgi:K+-transporting ATPase A subunit